jgi:hypothetical protein
LAKKSARSRAGWSAVPYSLAYGHSFIPQILSLSSNCFYHIRDLRCIRPFIDFKTACTIATSIVHSKLDYCNSLYHNLHQTQINRIQLIQNALARTVSRTPKSHHISPVINHSTGLRLRNVSNTKSFLSHTIHSSFPNPLISAPSSLYSHLA